MEDLERLAARLSNIEAVEPLLSALRAIALGSRLAAINKRRSVRQYRDGLWEVIAALPADLPRDARPASEANGPGDGLTLLVIGSERGLCGTFNDVIVAQAEQALSDWRAAGTRVTLMTLGAKAERALRQQGCEPAWSGKLSLTALPSFALARHLASEWLRSYERRELTAVEVMYNDYRGMVEHFESTSVRVLPLMVPPANQCETESPAIIETDPQELYAQAVELWLAAALYEILLTSAAAEQTARYSLLDGATQNAERLIDELTLFLQAARQEAVTSEMLDLASGAGLIGPRQA